MNVATKAFTSKGIRLPSAGVSKINGPIDNNTAILRQEPIVTVQTLILIFM